MGFITPSVPFAERRFIAMAKERIMKFFETAKADQALAEKLAALSTENGYDFTAEELLDLGAARPLTDEEANTASGGYDKAYASYCETLKYRHLCFSCGTVWENRDGERRCNGTPCPKCSSTDTSFLT